MAIEKHTHCDLIKAWADGAEIQYYETYTNGGTWRAVANRDLNWHPEIVYRIKPKSKIVKFKVAMLKGYITEQYPVIIFDTEYSKWESHSDFIKWISSEYCYEVYS